jgi:hypothetical protein
MWTEACQPRQKGRNCEKAFIICALKPWQIIDGHGSADGTVRMLRHAVWGVMQSERIILGNEIQTPKEARTREKKLIG